MMPSALFVEGSSSVTIERCDVRRLGGAGVTFGGGSANSIVRHCRFDDVSGSAVQLGGSVRNGTLEVDSTAPAQVGLSATDNTITNLPAEYHDAVGIFGGYLFGAVIAHNSLENLSCECRG
jgi:dienelactone hydrolase